MGTVTTEAFTFALLLHKSLEFCLHFHLVFSFSPCTFLLWCQSEAALWPHQPIHDQFSCFFLSKIPSHIEEIATFAFYRTLLLGYIEGRTNTSLEDGYSHYSYLPRKESCQVVPAILGPLVSLCLNEVTQGRTSPLQFPHLPQLLLHSCCFSDFFWFEYLSNGWLLPALQKVTGMPQTRIKHGQVIHPCRQGAGNVRVPSFC